MLFICLQHWIVELIAPQNYRWCSTQPALQFGQGQAAVHQALLGGWIHAVAVVPENTAGTR